MPQRCDAISRVAPILDYQVPLVELLVDLPQVATDACSAPHGSTQDPAYKYRVGVDLLIREPALPGVPPTEHAAGELNVLLRNKASPCPFHTARVTTSGSHELSRDIAYSGNPAASRASCSDENTRQTATFPSRTRRISNVRVSTGMPPRPLA